MMMSMKHEIKYVTYSKLRQIWDAVWKSDGGYEVNLNDVYDKDNPVSSDMIRWTLDNGCETQRAVSHVGEHRFFFENKELAERFLKRWGTKMINVMIINYSGLQIADIIKWIEDNTVGACGGDFSERNNIVLNYRFELESDAKAFEEKWG